MIPHFVNNDYYSGISAACNTLMKLASGEISEPQSDDEEDLVYALISIILILFVADLLTFPRLRVKIYVLLAHIETKVS